MRISWKWLSEMVDLGKLAGPQALADLLTSRGLEVESIEPQSRGLEKVITAQILEKSQHPQADRLSVCMVTIGSGEPVQIVCGAQNMKAGDKVALAQPGANLPNGLKIEVSKIRGVQSNGMLCSEEELKFAEISDGILILPADAGLGVPLANTLGKDDVILTLKLTANRGDCLSHWGIAREVAAALSVQPKRPDVKLLDFTKTSPVAIELKAGDAAPQFFGCLIEGVRIGPSPDWLVKRLEALGSRSINNVVDASNLLMLELGHPTHAYDADKIHGNLIGVRAAREGEELPLLDGQTATLNGTELVIYDGERAVGLAGVMGGGNSEVAASTTRVFLECAEFDPVRVRRAAFRHQRRTEAAIRFEKGIDPGALPYVTSRLAQLITSLGGGKVVGAGAAIQPVRREPAGRKIVVEPGFFESFLGMKVSSDKAESVLKGLDCSIQKGAREWTVTPPSYRLDIASREDLSEEIARSLGYDQIAETIPELSSAPTSVSSSPSLSRQVLTERAKDILMQSGLNETLNFAFTSKSWLSRFGMSSSATLLNPLSEEHEALVPSLIPGLVKNTLETWNRHFGSESPAIRLFEIRPAFRFNGDGEASIRALDELRTGVDERWRIAVALSGARFAGGLSNEQGQCDFYDLKAVMESLLTGLGVRGVRIQGLSSGRTHPDPDMQAFRELLHPGKSAEVLVGKDVAGYFGLLHPGKSRELKAQAPLWLAELSWDVLAQLARPATEARPFQRWSEFPPMERDFALLVSEEVTADKITQLALKAGKPLAKGARIFDIYRGSQVPQGMTSVAVRVIFYEESRSLQESETEAASARILEAWKKELGAELRS
ncbi:MAG: phenylalanine--tRNA ligase subunit beta [Bdellovibrionales bacterium GWB1_55_8]|nr:MAG: phenylalanine--tRNA ligase subunit beta [Bdellovibrionales bacterium GWB1_55_8]